MGAAPRGRLGVGLGERVAPHVEQVRGRLAGEAARLALALARLPVARALGPRRRGRPSELGHDGAEAAAEAERPHERLVPRDALVALDLVLGLGRRDVV